MLKATVLACGAAFALLVLAPDDAAARDGGTRAGKAQVAKKKVSQRSVRGATRAETRAGSVGANGLCQRDTGTPTSQLNMRNRCDVEEFWQRLIDLGSSGDSD